MLNIKEIIAKSFMFAEKIEINDDTYINKDHTLFIDEEKMTFSSSGHVYCYWRVDGKTRRKDVTSEVVKAMTDILAAYENEPDLEEFLNKVSSEAMASYVGCSDAINCHIIEIMKNKLKEKYDNDYIDNAYNTVYDAGESEMAHFAPAGYSSHMVKKVLKEAELK